MKIKRYNVGEIKKERKRKQTRGQLKMGRQPYTKKTDRRTDRQTTREITIVKCEIRGQEERDRHKKKYSEVISLG